MMLLMRIRIGRFVRIGSYSTVALNSRVLFRFSSRLSVADQHFSTGHQSFSKKISFSNEQRHVNVSDYRSNPKIKLTKILKNFF
jgi:hypothetical protein